MKMRRSVLLALFCLPAAALAEGENWTLIFSDDFNTGAIDTAKWSKFDYVNWNVADWRKFQSQDDALYQSNADSLTLWGRYGDYTSQSDKTGAQDGYACAGLNTQGKFSFQYGKVEVRAKFDSVQGVWPAIWMLPTHPVSWLGSGEIDLMEHLNYEGSAHQTLHYTANNGTNASSYTTVNKAYSDLQKIDPTVGDKTEWHTYGVEWTADAITFSIDGIKTDTFNAAGENNWPFSTAGNEFYLIVDQQIGGSWVQGLGDTGINQTKLAGDGAAFEIDSVRVYTQTQQEGSSFTTGGVKVSTTENTVLSGLAGAADFAVTNGDISVDASAKGTVNLTAKLTDSRVVNANDKASLVLDVRHQPTSQTALVAEKGDITFTNAGEILLSGLTLGEGRTVAAYIGTEQTESQEATIIVAANKEATFEEGATLLANLTIRNGVTLNMSGALTLGSSLVLNWGENLALIDKALVTTGSVLLFDSVEALTLRYEGGGATTAAERRYDASGIFKSISAGGETLAVDDYDIAYHNGRVSLLHKSLAPEPATATLSQLALAALSARRRRR